MRLTERGADLIDRQRVLGADSFNGGDRTHYRRHVDPRTGEARFPKRMSGSIETLGKTSMIKSCESIRLSQSAQVLMG